MMEEGDEALGFEREIYWLSGQAEMWLDRIGRAITEPVHVDRVARTIAALEDIERRAGTRRCAVAASNTHGLAHPSVLAATKKPREFRFWRGSLRGWTKSPDRTRATGIANCDRSLLKLRSIGPPQRSSDPLTPAPQPAEASRRYPWGRFSSLPFSRRR